MHRVVFVLFLLLFLLDVFRCWNRVEKRGSFGRARQENIHSCPCERDVRGVDTWSVNDLLGWRGNYFVPKLSRIEKLFKDVTKVRTKGIRFVSQCYFIFVDDIVRTREMIIIHTFENGLFLF